MGNKKTKISGSTGLTAKRIDALKHVTKFSEAEIQEWHAEFLRDCPNGKLDKKEFRQVYKKYYLPDKADIFCNYIFKIFDTDMDNSISFDEFLIAVSPASQGPLDARLELTFDMYDTSNDKNIDREELIALITVMYNLVGVTDRKGEKDPKQRADDIIKKLDQDHDNKLNKQEFIDGCKNDSFIRQLLAPNFEDVNNTNIV